MLSWKTNADESDGLTMYFPTLPKDGLHMATGNLVDKNHLAPVMPDLNEKQHIVHNKDKIRGIN